MSASGPAGKPDGINVIGLVSGHSGLGIAARNVVYALQARKFAVAVLDLDDGHGRKGGAKDFAALTVERPQQLPHAVNLFVLPPAMLAREVVAASEFEALLTREGALNVALTFWELLQLPKSWTRALEVFDAVVAPSPFVEGLLDASLSRTPVVRGLVPVDLPPDIVAAREHFGLEAGTFVAVSSFDPLSDPQRKNPFGAVEAFRRAFPDDPNVRLVVKLNVPRSCGEEGRLHQTVIQPLLTRLGGDPRVKLITQAMDYADVLRLYASADAFVSLHRAEGLGLGLLEAMALGKPVIATGWSGNKAFMTPSCSCLVRYELVPVSASLPAYTTAMRGLSPYWAEPDLDDAAAWLRQLAASTSLRQRLGEQAKAAFARYREAAARIEFVDDVLAIGEHLHAESEPERRRETMRAEIAVARQQVRRDSLGLARWLARLGSEHFQRHLGWRLRARRA